MKSIPEQIGPERFRVGLEKAPFPGSEEDAFWLILINDSRQQLLGVEILDAEPSFEACRDWLLSVIADPPDAQEPPMLPALLLVNEPSLYAALRFSLRPYKIAVKHDPEPESLLKYVGELRPV
jgi:hypothetical protein